MYNQINVSNNNSQPTTMSRILVDNTLYALKHPNDGAPKTQKELASRLVPEEANDSGSKKTMENKISRIMQNPELLTLNEAESISKILGIPLYKLIDPQFKEYCEYEPVSKRYIEAFVKKTILNTNQHKLIWTEFRADDELENRLSRTKKYFVDKNNFWRTEEYLREHGISCEGLMWHTCYEPKNSLHIGRFEPHKVYMLELPEKSFLYLVNTLDDSWYLIFQWVDENGSNEEVICMRDETTCSIPSDLFEQLINVAESNVSMLSVSSRALNKMHSVFSPESRRK